MQFWVAALATPILIFAALAGHFSGIAFLHVPPPTPIVLVKCAGVATTGTIAHWLIYIATQRASATVVAPMVYVQLLVAGLIGWFAFGNSIDPITGVGMAVIVCAGLLLWRSQRDPMLTVPPD
jgi:drug/metabolite transporter (DMT)-like permease